MSKIRSTRQRVRRALLIVAFLAFPITMNYFSPYVIIDGASQGVVNGSLVVFGLMFLSSLVLGRLWCGWACPAGALGEICQPVNDRPVHLKKLDWIKWAIWIPWIGIIVAMVIRAGGYQRVDLLLDTVNGISVAGDADRPIVFAYVIYYMVIALFAGLAMLAWQAGRLSQPVLDGTLHDPGQENRNPCLAFPAVESITTAVRTARPAHTTAR